MLGFDTFTKKKLDQGIHARKEDFDFHKLLARTTKNHLFVIIMEAIMAFLAVLLSKYLFDLEVQKYIVEEHQKMLDALKSNEPMKAYNYLEDYLNIIQNSYTDITIDEEG